MDREGHGVYDKKIEYASYLERVCVDVPVVCELDSLIVERVLFLIEGLVDTVKEQTAGNSKYPSDDKGDVLERVRNS